MLAAAGTLLGRRLRWPAPAREHWTPAGRSRSRREAAEADVDAPVFQYVGERAARADRVFVWGFSFSGALGVPSFVVPASGPEPRAGLRPRRRIQPVPYRLELDHKISSAACGYGFTLLSSKTKDVTKVWARGYEYVLEPSPVPLPLHRPQETKVLQVSCGRAHSLILTDREGVFSMGNNSHGQCGRKVVEDEVYRLSVVRTTACSSQTEGKSILVDGVPMDRQKRSKKVSEVRQHCCLGHYNITSTPTKLGGDLAGVTVVQIATYGDCCLAVSSDGSVFGWGNSEYLQLASVTDSTQVNVPRCLPFSEVGKVKQVACGGTGCAVLNDKGELFVWGKNIRGCLGIGRLEDQYFPWRVTMPGEPVDVACGVDHMVTLAKSFI
ncbi:hypothetical protein A6R68_01985 [Neotoma lepida]|uniref:RCC1-like G exchanging factor-like protein n=1 Tax=Neotoma lepida TaxID=56216 RepID=A0A1A6GU49_NEOLE|nr:hypothetical protein A6R68_01985 [Neotoma lepida]